MKMKRLLCLGLILTLLLSICAEPAMAKQYTIYGDGSKAVTELEDKKGNKFKYYDVYAGSKSRDDASDAVWFAKKILLSKPTISGIVDSQANAWDRLLRLSLLETSPERVGNNNLRALCTQLAGIYSKQWINEVTVCNGTDAAAEGIRRDFTELNRKEVGRWDSGAAEYKDLKLVKYSGPTFYTMNVAANPRYYRLGYGSIFYDFQLQYMEDGKVADSAVGSETDIKKLVGRRGFVFDQAPFALKKSDTVYNDTSGTITAESSIKYISSSSMENSVSTTNEHSASLMVGAEVKFGWKFPVFNIGGTLKSEFTTKWLASITRGQSKRQEETTEITSKLSVPLPPKSKAIVDLYAANTSMSSEYDYPVAVTFKVIQYVIMDRDKIITLASWGNKGTDQPSAVENLLERYNHRSDRGYENLFGGGYPVNWGASTNLETNPALNMLKGYVPMSITGSKVTSGYDMFKMVARDPVRISPATLVEAEGPKALTVAVGGALDLTEAVRVSAYDDEDGERAAYYDFNEKTDGIWAACDQDGAPVEQSKAAITVDPRGHSILRAGATPGSLHVIYRPDARELEYYDGDELRYTDVSEIENATIRRVDIVGQLPDFDGTVSAQGPLSVALRAPLDLRRVAVSLRDSGGAPVEPVLPFAWTVEGDGATIRSGVLTASKSGDYRLRVSYAGVSSDAVKLTVEPGAKADGVTLNQSALRINKYDSAMLTAQVSPANAENQGVSWSSSDETVAKVGADGKVSAVGTGYAVVTATTMDGGFKAQCEVTVEVQNPGEGLGMGKLAMAKGTSRKLSAPGGAIGAWSVENPAIATYRGGVLRARALGETALTFSVTDARGAQPYLGKALKAGDVITVPLAVRKPGELASSVRLGSNGAYLATGHTVSLSPTVKPAAAKDKEVFYRTSDKTVALVDDGGTVTGVNSGTATITASTCTGKTAKFTVRVTGDIQSIRTNAKSIALEPYKSANISATAVPAGLPFTPYFVSSDPSVAAVGQDGMVSGLRKGACKIYVYRMPGSRMRAEVSVAVK